MRFLLILLLIHGLVPGISELVESAVHRVQTGHFAHAPGDPHDEGSTTTEHGCGATAHRCQCCSNLTAVARIRFSMDRPVLNRIEPFFGLEADRADGIASSVFRPPIA